jgi:hypothetical protein
MKHLIEEQALRFKCPYCMALPGHRCVTENQERAHGWLHTQRTGPLLAAWRDGYHEGVKEKDSAKAS